MVTEADPMRHHLRVQHLLAGHQLRAGLSTPMELTHRASCANIQLELGHDVLPRCGERAHECVNEEGRAHRHHVGPLQ